MKRPIIFVSGPSGVGKTSIVNKLIKLFPLHYKRPKSYTSRKRRPKEGEEEYIFSDKETISLLYKNGELINLDDVYGNLYGISKCSLYDIQKESTMCIKEMHPQSIDKIDINSVYYIIKVLILPASRECFYNRNERNESLNYYFSDELVDRFDIVLYNNFYKSIDSIAKELNYKIISVTRNIVQFPLPSKIDQINKKGYSLILPEFTEDKRITTHNFHTLSYRFWKSHVDTFKKNASILEVGAGQGWLNSLFKLELFEYWVADIIQVNKPSNYNVINSSIKGININDEFFDYVLCSLIDPYFYPLALYEIFRVLKNNGQLICTLPAHEWSQTIRHTNKNVTTFERSDGEKAEVFSFTPSAKEIFSMLAEVGFSIIQFDKINGNFDNQEIISPALRYYAQIMQSPLEELPVVYFITAKK